MGRAADNEDTIDRLVSADPVARWLGMRRVTPLDGAEAAFEMVPTEEHTNFLGGVHGGALFSLADSAMAAVSNAPGGVAVAVDAHTSYTAAATVGEIVRCDIEVVTRSRALATHRAVLRRADGRVVATFRGTTFLRE